MSRSRNRKSDLNQKWMGRRADRRRPIQPEYHLIVTEGEKTEPLYFEPIRRTINRQYRERIQLKVCGRGGNTLDLFCKAYQQARSSVNGCRHVWIVYDTDDFPAADVDRTARLCEQRSTDVTQFHAIWSNQCFELWFLLHMGFFHADIHRREYPPKISRWLMKNHYGAYTKTRTDMYAILRPYLDRAMDNAERLSRLNAGKKPSESSPGTQMHLLMKKLKPYL